MVDSTDASNFGQWLVAAGMAVGAGIAGAFMRAAWKKPGGDDQDKEFMVSGQAAITDMKPVRDLVEQAVILSPRLAAVVQVVERLAASQEKLTDVQHRSAAHAEKLIDIIEGYIEAQQTAQDNEEEIERRVNDRIRNLNDEEIKKQVRQITDSNTRRRRSTAAAKRTPRVKTEG